MWTYYLMFLGTFSGGVPERCVWHFVLGFHNRIERYLSVYPVMVVPCYPGYMSIVISGWCGHVVDGGSENLNHSVFHSFSRSKGWGYVHPIWKCTLSRKRLDDKTHIEAWMLNKENNLRRCCRTLQEEGQGQNTWYR